MRRPPLQKAAPNRTPAVTETSGVEAEGEDVRVQSRKGKTYACASCEDLFYKSEVRICNENNAEHDGEGEARFLCQVCYEMQYPDEKKVCAKRWRAQCTGLWKRTRRWKDAVGLVGPKRKGESRSAYRARLQNELKQMAEE